MKKISLTLALILYSIKFFAQNITLSGYILDKHTGDYLVSPIIIIDTSKFIADYNGYFVIKISKGKHKIKINQLGYETFTTELNLQKDTTIKLELVPDSILIEKVKVSANQNHINKYVINPQKVIDLPIILGEKDVLKTIQFLPGLAGGYEGSTNIYIRGSEAGNNLIIFDGIPLYNTYHIFGFLSFINPHIIKTIKLYKGGFPAKYSGRNAAVIDIYSKEGNFKKTKKFFSFGLFSINLLMETPIKKNKLSSIVAFRRSFLDLFIFPIYSILSSEKNYFYFYDLNFKISYKPNNKNTFLLSFYTSKDLWKQNYKFEENNYLEYNYERFQNHLFWQNLGISFRYNITPVKFLNLNFTSFFNQYTYENKISEEIFIINKDKNFSDTTSTFSLKKTSSAIKDFGNYLNLTFFITNFWKTKIGSKFIYHTFFPVNFYSEFNDSFDKINIDFNSTEKINTKELAFYLQNDFNFFKLNANIGIVFNKIYTNDTNFFSPEPRVSLSYKITPILTIETSFTKANQFVHLLQSSNLNLPTDIWLPITKKIPPSYTKIYDFGFSFNSKKITSEFSVFYKNIFNVIRLNQGANLFDPSIYWQNNILSGEGESYGFEVFFKFITHKNEILLSYTYSRAWRIFKIYNNYEKFPFKFDRPHDLNIIVKRKIKKSFEFTANFTFKSGYNFTIYNQQIPVYIFNTINPANYYEKINNYRLPPYHRLDIAFNKKITKNKKTKIISAGIYNVYNRKNPFFVKIMQYGNQTVLEGICLFPFMPFLSYTLIF